jgi:predicted MFS family arabinose efflux permease
VADRPGWLSVRERISMHTQTSPLSKGLTLLFALASGIIIANIYYAQPLLVAIARDFGYAPAHLGFLVTLTQLGYAAGMILIVPLGDVLNRRTMIVSLLMSTVLTLLAVAISPTMLQFALASLVLGISSCGAQLQVPFAASLATDKERGQVVGTVMSGLLLGILLARTVSGAIAQLAGWRAVYIVAALLALLLTACLLRALPEDRRSQPWRYSQLLGSLATLLKEHPAIGLRSLYGALGYACFSVFWTGLTFLLSQAPYHGAAGRLADRGHVARAGKLFSLGILVSFGFIYGGGYSLTALIAGVLLLDAGVQGMHISNQSIIYALAPQARSRVTTIYLTCYFIGGAIGSSAASIAYARAGWAGVCLAGGVFAVLLVVCVYAGSAGAGLKAPMKIAFRRVTGHR